MRINTIFFWIVQDDATALDLDTMKRWNMLMRIFMSEYLGLQPEAEQKSRTLERDNGDLVRTTQCDSLCLTIKS